MIVLLYVVELVVIVVVVLLCRSYVGPCLCRVLLHMGRFGSVVS